MPTQRAMPHFNPRGELIQPLSSVEHPAHSMRPCNSICMCTRVGCGVHLPSVHSPNICGRCPASNPTGLTLSQLRAPKIENVLHSLNCLNEISNNGDDDIDGIEFMYPEEPAYAEPPKPHSVSILSVSIPLHTHISHPLHGASPTNKTQDEPDERQNPKLNYPSRVCGDAGCPNPLQYGLKTTRCLGCMMKDWKSRNGNVKSSEKGGGKTVSWSEFVSIQVDGEDGTASAPLRRLSEVEEPVDVNQVGGISRDEVSNISIPNQHPPANIFRQKTERLTIRIPPSNYRRSQPKPGKVAFDEISPTIENDAATITGEGSNLTDLFSSPNKEMGFEIKLSSDSDQPKSSGLTIRLPARLAARRTDNRICSVKKCQKLLPAGYRWKSCITCRGHRPETYATVAGSLPDAHHITPGARFCCIKNCMHTIPSTAEYHQKTCKLYHTRTRGLSRKKKESERITKYSPSGTGEVGTTGGDRDSINTSAVCFIV
ncbi:hypothetical protein BDZ94DRAFT_1271613 [Collybia nuda]|uniref:Uncharacterized protein n=1 Tax=Collybia nuda TaxID=64659 RepID=A0A9P5XV04_9AGAR|nr:hypothetical protein BDZ94DRAFT_1271613 [Collybia nuda]